MELSGTLKIFPIFHLITEATLYGIRMTSQLQIIEVEVDRMDDGCTSKGKNNIRDHVKPYYKLLLKCFVR